MGAELNAMLLRRRDFLSADIYQIKKSVILYRVTDDERLSAKWAGLAVNQISPAFAYGHEDEQNSSATETASSFDRPISSSRYIATLSGTGDNASLYKLLNEIVVEPFTTTIHGIAVGSS